MKNLIQYDLGNGKTFFIELEEPELKGKQKTVSIKSKALEHATQLFSDALSPLKPLSKSLIDTMSAVGENLKEIELEFGIKLDSQANIILAASKLEAHIKVTLKWIKE